MTRSQQDIAELEERTAEHERVAHHALNFETWLKNELRAAELRRRIEVLDQRLAKLQQDRSNG